ncbi:hypothetical protein EEL53_10265 [Muribaculaceae bacterium Isolate-114 (HZI)]|nr:hypothetical protein EEL53_10265 [Muribaculaceae bacterium Isolate-114 (HZI)]
MKAKRKSDGKVIEVKPQRFMEHNGSMYAPSDLDFNVEEAEEVTIDGWLTRSVSGNIVFSDSSECRKGNRVWYHKEGANVVDLDETGLFPNNLFPSLTWESNPLEVTITIKPKKK